MSYLFGTISKLLAILIDFIYRIGNPQQIILEKTFDLKSATLCTFLKLLGSNVMNKAQIFMQAFLENKHINMQNYYKNKQILFKICTKICNKTSH